MYNKDRDDVDVGTTQSETNQRYQNLSNHFLRVQAFELLLDQHTRRREEYQEARE